MKSRYTWIALAIVVVVLVVTYVVCSQPPAPPPDGGGPAYCTGPAVSWAITPLTPMDDNPAPVLTIDAPRAGDAIPAGANITVTYRHPGWPRTGFTDTVHLVLVETRYGQPSVTKVAMERVPASNPDNVILPGAQSGWYTLFIFACRGIPHEPVQTVSAMSFVRFRVGNPTTQESAWDPAKDPAILYAGPLQQVPSSGETVGNFYLYNVTLSAGYNRVAVGVDGTFSPNCQAVRSPYRLYNMIPGGHRICFQLVDATGQPMTGPFSNSDFDSR